MSKLPTYAVEAPEPDPAEVEQLIGVQRDGLQLVLRDLGLEVARHLGSQEEALAKVTNALKRRLQTQLRGQVKALVPLMDAIHGRIASGIAEQQVALSTLMDQAVPPSGGPSAPTRYFHCNTGTPVQGPDGRWGCLYNGTVHYDDPITGQAVGMWVYDSPGTGFPPVADTVGPSPAPAPGGTAPAPTGTAPATAPPGTYPVPAPGDTTGGSTDTGATPPAPAMCCPPCPAPAPPPPATDETPLVGGLTGAGGVSNGDTPGFPTTGAAGAGSSPPCPAAPGYALSDCGIDYWREGATGLIATEAVQAMLASPDWRELLMPGISGPADQPLFPLGSDPFSLADGNDALGFLDTGGKQ